MTIDEPEGDSAANAPTSTASIDDGETHSHDTDDSDLSVGKGGSDSIGIPGDPVPLDPDHSIAGDPAEAPSLCDAAAGLVESGDFAEAIIGYRRAISLDPAFAPGYAGLGIALEAKGHIGAAIAAVRRSLAISPDNAAAHANLGRLLKIKGEFREAALCWFRAIELDAEDASFHLGLGIALRDMGLAAESVLSLQKARELAPDQPEILHEAGQAEVLLGHISTGFAGVAARTKLTDSTSPQHDGPKWTGEDISGKTILVYADGRLSETLMLSRFVTELARRGATVLLECQAPLVGMLSTLSGVSRALPRGDIVPNYDVKVALIELPALLELDTEAMLPKPPYLKPPKRRMGAAGRLPVPAGTHLKIGIAWGGRSLHATLSQRMSFLENYLDLLRMPGVTLFSLQRRDHAPDLHRIGATGLIVDLGPRINDFQDTAALLCELDLIISVDTAVAHLAAAMGRPVWVLLPYVPPWQYGLDREMTPWYPSMRLFRQQAPNDWSGAFSEINNALNGVEPTSLLKTLSILGRDAAAVEEEQAVGEDTPIMIDLRGRSLSRADDHPNEEPKPEPPPESEPQPELGSEPEPEPDPHPEQETDLEPEPEPETLGIPDADSEPAIALEPERAIEDEGEEQVSDAVDIGESAPQQDAGHEDAGPESAVEESDDSLMPADLALEETEEFEPDPDEPPEEPANPFEAPGVGAVASPSAEPTAEDMGSEAAPTGDPALLHSDPSDELSEPLSASNTAESEPEPEPEAEPEPDPAPTAPNFDEDKGDATESTPTSDTPSAVDTGADNAERAASMQADSDGVLPLPSAFRDELGRPRFTMPILREHFRDPDIINLCRQEADFGGYEYAARRFLDDHLLPGDVFIDVGAHWGVFAMTAASRWPGEVKVLGVEPEIENLRRMRRWVDANHMTDDVEVIAAAVGERRATAVFERTTSMRHKLVGLRGPDAAPLEGDFDIPVASIDEIMDARPELHGRRVFMKIDVEGSEPEAITGAEELLDSGRVAAIIWSRGKHFDREPDRERLLDMMRFLQDRNFVHLRFPHDVLGGAMVPFLYGHEICNVYSLAKSFPRKTAYPRPPGPYVPAPRPSSAKLPPGARAQWAELMIIGKTTDAGRWSDPVALEPGAEERATLAAPFVTGPNVLDLGAGLMKVANHLPDTVSYMPADLLARAEDSIVFDLNQGETPPPPVGGGRYQTILLLHVLEFVHDAPGLLARLGPLAERLIVGYAPAPALTPGDDDALEEVTHVRRSHGYFNDWTQDVLRNTLLAAGWQVEEDSETSIDGEDYVQLVCSPR